MNVSNKHLKNSFDTIGMIFLIACLGIIVMNTSNTPFIYHPLASKKICYLILLISFVILVLLYFQKFVYDSDDKDYVEFTNEYFIWSKWFTALNNNKRIAKSSIVHVKLIRFLFVGFLIVTTKNFDKVSKYYFNVTFVRITKIKGVKKSLKKIIKHNSQTSI